MDVVEYSRALSHLDDRQLIIFCRELSLTNTYPIIGTSDTKSNLPSKSSGGEGGIQTHTATMTETGIEDYESTEQV